MKSGVEVAATKGSAVGALEGALSGEVLGVSVGSIFGGVLGGAIGFATSVGATALLGPLLYPQLEKLSDFFVDKQIASIRQSYRQQCDRMFPKDASATIP